MPIVIVPSVVAPPQKASHSNFLEEKKISFYPQAAQLNRSQYNYPDKKPKPKDRCIKPWSFRRNKLARFTLAGIYPSGWEPTNTRVVEWHGGRALSY
jgi:hypothetical protein